MYGSHNVAQRRRSMQIQNNSAASAEQAALAMQRQMAAAAAVLDSYDSSDDDGKGVEVRRRRTASRSMSGPGTPRSDNANGGGSGHKEKQAQQQTSSGADDAADGDSKEQQTTRAGTESNTETTATTDSQNRSKLAQALMNRKLPFMSLIDQSRSMRRLALEQSHHGRPPSDVGTMEFAADSDIFRDDGDAEADAEYYATPDFKLGDPLHEDTACLGPSRNAVGRAINRNFVSWTLMFLILVNSLILGALTFLHGSDKKASRDALETTNLALLVVFTVELTAQSYYLGLQFFRQGWLLFDAIVILLSWAFEGSDLSVMRSFRIFRLFAMVAKWTSLRHLFRAIGKTMPKMGTIAAVLVLFFYSFSVFYTNLYFGVYEDGYLDWDYFGRLDLTFLTLFQVMTMDSWTQMVRQLMESGYPWAWVGFVIWVIITAFFFISLIVAVVCESLFELNDIKEKSRQKKMFKHQNNAVKNQTKKLMDENKHLLEIQQEMLANQIVMQKTLMEVIEQLQEYKKRDAVDGGDNVDNGDNVDDGDNGRASQLDVSEQSLSEKTMSNLLATFAADGTIRRASEAGGASSRRSSADSKR